MSSHRYGHRFPVFVGALAVVAIGALTAGCGGGGNNQPSTTTTTTTTTTTPTATAPPTQKTINPTGGNQFTPGQAVPPITVTHHGERP